MTSKTDDLALLAERNSAFRPGRRTTHGSVEAERIAQPALSGENAR